MAKKKIVISKPVTNVTVIPVVVKPVELFPKGSELLESKVAVMCVIDHSITTMKIGNTPICMKCLLEKINKGEIKLQVV